MRKTTDNKKIAPILVAVLVAALVILYSVPLIVIVLISWRLLENECIVVLPILLSYVIFGGAVIAGVLIALTQRLREINGGEEDEAKKY